MERCPNCGSTVRSGAKFCTTCGFRLPETAAEPAADGSRSPFDTTSSVTGRWSAADPAAAPQPAPERPSEPVVDDIEIAAVPAVPVVAEEVPPMADSPAETPAAEPEPAPQPSGSFAGWPSFATGYAASGPSEPATADAADEQPADEPVLPDGTAAGHGQPPAEESEAVWTSGTETGGGEDADATLDIPAEEAPGAAAEAAAEAPAFEPTPSQDAAWSSPSATDAEPVAGEEGSDAESPGPEEAAASDTEEPPPAEPEMHATENPSVEPEAIPVPAPAVEAPAERAERLLAELAALLPALGAGSPGGGVDHAAVVAALAESRAAAETEAETFRSLRAAVATAQARPRDVDVMLDLVGRADAMAAVMAAHDRYAAAIDAATRALRGEAEEPAPPRW